MAQERMANNFVYVFEKKQPSKFSWVAEIRSQVDGSHKPANQFAVKMMAKRARSVKGGVRKFGQAIVATIPLIN